MKKSLFVLPALLMACGFEPEAGTYDMETTATEDGCAVEDAGEGDTGADESTSTMDIVFSDDGSTLTIDGETTCERSGRSFSCDDTFEVLDAADFDMVAIISMNQILNAKWTDPTHFDGDFEIGLVCEGDDCTELVETMLEIDVPCTSVGTFSASKSVAAAEE